MSKILKILFGFSFITNFIWIIERAYAIGIGATELSTGFILFDVFVVMPLLVFLFILSEEIEEFIEGKPND